MELAAGQPFDYETQKKCITQLYTAYPFLRVRVPGRSALGRGLFALQLGNEKNAVLCAGSFCGEGESARALLLFAAALCKGLAEKKPLCGVDLTCALAAQGIVLLPCVNPDGAEINAHGPQGALQLRRFVQQSGWQAETPWRANALGVEVGGNFPCRFALRRQAQLAAGFASPAGAGCCGASPASEAETRTLMRFCHAGRFRKALAVDAAGGGAFTAFLPPDDPAAAKETAVAAKILADSCALRPARADPVLESGSFGGWFAQTFRRAAFALNAPREPAEALLARLQEALVLFLLM